jgi:hypothetical protein
VKNIFFGIDAINKENYFQNKQQLLEVNIPVNIPPLLLGQQELLPNSY